mgnify:CR=1 FL=1
MVRSENELDRHNSMSNYRVKKPISKVVAKKPVNGMDILELYDRMNMNNIILSFKGDITTGLMSSVLQIMEDKLNNYDEKPRIRKKVYNVLVECLQNLYHHVDPVPDSIGRIRNGDSSAIFMIGLEEDRYKIITGNYVRSDRIPELKERLEYINSKDHDDLRTLYKEVLNNEERSDKGGGGLGMIDIARKTGGKLSYDITAINEQYAFFTLNINVEQ